MTDTINGIVSLFLMMALGFLLAKLGWIDAKAESFIVKLALKVSVPCALFTNAVKYLAQGFSAMTPLTFLLPPCTIAVCLLIGFAASRLLKIERSCRGLTVSVFALSNTIIIGLPVCTAVYGESGVPFVILYYMANTVIFWTVGVNMIAADGGANIRFNLTALKRVLSPAIIGFLVGLACTLLKFTPPAAVMKAVTSVGSMNTPLCMIIVGSMIAKLGFREVARLGKAGWLVLCGRLIVSPLVVTAVCLLLKCDPLPASVYVMMSAMPAMNQSVLVAKSYGSDDALATKLLSASALLMLASVPLLSWLNSLIFG